MANKQRVAQEAWKAIMDLIVASAPERSAPIGKAGLTPNDMRALSTISLAEEGRTMRSLADEWRCDASTVTWIVDRLEQRGLAERRPHPTDRRSRLVALTPAGAALWAGLQKAVYQPPRQLLELNEADLVALRNAASKLPHGSTD
jgi:MarR family transcriptional regulator, organic hydroperoxide resistance regulator